MHFMLTRQSNSSVLHIYHWIKLQLSRANILHSTFNSPTKPLPLPPQVKYIMITYSIFLIGMPSGAEWLLVILALLLLFGGRKIPELMRGIGQGIREFQDAKGNVKKEIEKGMNERPKEEKSEETK